MLLCCGEEEKKRRREEEVVVGERENRISGAAHAAYIAPESVAHPTNHGAIIRQQHVLHWL